METAIRCRSWAPILILQLQDVPTEVFPLGLSASGQLPWRVSVPPAGDQIELEAWRVLHRTGATGLAVLFSGSNAIIITFGIVGACRPSPCGLVRSMRAWLRLWAFRRRGCPRMTLPTTQCDDRQPLHHQCWTGMSRSWCEVHDKASRPYSVSDRMQRD